MGDIKTNDKKDSRVGFIVLLICLSIHFYWNFPTYMFGINSQDSVATIEELDRSHLKYSYHNAFTNSSFEVIREINLSEYSKLTQKDKLKVIYPKWFPDAVIVEELERMPTIIWPLIFQSFLIWGLIKIGISLLNRH